MTLDIVDDKVNALYEKMLGDETLNEGIDTDRTDPDCWRETVIMSAFEKACKMVTEESPDDAEMHPMDAIDIDNVENVYATDEPWAMPVIVIQLDEKPEYVAPRLTETKQVEGRRKAGRTQETTKVQIQIR